LEWDDDGARWVGNRGGGQQGVLRQTEASFADRRRHRRRFLRVRDESGKRYRFRFFDPRVLRSFLPACAADELADFFGPVACFYASGRKGDLLLTYRNGPKELVTDEYPVDRSEAPADDAGLAARDPGKGALTVRLTDAATGAPIANASVRAEGPTGDSAVTGPWGDVRFEGLEVGEYEVFAIDEGHRMARAAARVTPEGARLHLRCRVEPQTLDAEDA
ncbi:MAG: DUF4123 domain-containing protein, partial [bacterium]|nr:DUF4123 domain-containing protein [bacterium]